MSKAVALALPFLLLGGCVQTVASVVTAPVKIVAQGADWATTSQDEADRNRGRRLRKAEERARKDCRKQFDDDAARQRCFHERGINEGY